MNSYQRRMSQSEVPKSQAGKTNEINERMLNPVIKKIKPEEMQRSFGGGHGVICFFSAALR